MPDTSTSPSKTGPAILIAVATVGMIIGFGRCGFITPLEKGVDDYGISGAFFIVVSLVPLIGGLVWFAKRMNAR